MRGYVGRLCMDMHGYAGLCTAVYGYIWLCRAMYGCVGLCTAMKSCFKLKKQDMLLVCSAFKLRSSYPSKWSEPFLLIRLAFH